MAAAKILFSKPVKIDRGISVRFKPECDKIKQLILHPNEKQKCRFKVDGKTVKRDWNPYNIKFEYSKSEMELTTSEWDLGKGEIALTNITTKKVGEFIITVKVNGIKSNEIKITSKELDKDVFSEKTQIKLVEEIEYIQPFADSGTVSEYSGNYCMQAAERAISELLSNSTDFYAVERGSHSRKSSVGFSGLTAIDRGNKIKSLGFVKTSWSFNKYKINQSDRKIINDSTDSVDAKKNYTDVRYTIISLSDINKKSFYDKIILDIKNHLGFHVYYLSITGGFHTLILVIDYRNPCKATFKIYDQHGLTSANGKLEDIGEGFRKQTSWTFANTCLNRYIKGKTKYWDATETQLWKIQEK